jgi:hypothetical protein
MKIALSHKHFDVSVNFGDVIPPHPSGKTPKVILDKN